MNRKNIIFIFFTLLYTISGYSQEYFKTYKQLIQCPYDTSNYYEFLLVKRADNPESARRINERLIKEVFWEDDYFDIAYDKRKDSIYIIKGSLKGSPESYELCPKMNFENVILRNDSLVFMLNQSGEGCGAYCEDYSSTYNFISKTGEEIKFKELFEPKAYFFIDKLILQSNRCEIKNQISNLKKEITTTTVGDDAEWDKEAISMYENCVYFSDFPYKYSWQKDTSFISDSDELKVYKDHLSVIGERCSPHALRCYDELGNFENSLNLIELKKCFVKKYFNVLVSGQKYSRSNYFLYSGKMNNKIAITLLLIEGENNAVQGLYFYDSKGILISLAGKKVGNEIELIEKDENGKDKYKFVLNKGAMKLTGKWKGIDVSNTKELSVELNEVNDFIILK